MDGYRSFALSPQVLRWARERVGLSEVQLAEKMGVKSVRIESWEQDGKISTKQTQKLAKIARAPLGCLYLREPVEDKLPIADFRAMRGEQSKKPSPNLMSAVYSMQRRQAWMRMNVIEMGHEKLPFVASMRNQKEPEKIAADMRRTLGLQEGWAKKEGTLSDALKVLRNRVEEAGILIFFNGIVGNNTHRKLDSKEFQGFALVDDYAPLIFVNSTDYESARIFTVAHELAHLWRGKQGVSNYLAGIEQRSEEERLCNKIAAAFLIPQREIQDCWDDSKHVGGNLAALTRQFKTSGIALAIRALEMNLIKHRDFDGWYEKWEVMEKRREADASKGGDFWKTQNSRIGKLFGSAVLHAVRDGRLLYKEAYSLTDLHGQTFDKFEQALEQTL